MHKKQKDLARQFNIGHTLTTQICRLVDSHPERYGVYARLGTRYSTDAFADAYKYKRELETGKTVPEFHSKELEEEDRKDCYLSGARAMKNEIYDGVDDYFKHTKFPDPELARVIRLGVLSAIVTAEVKP